MSASSTLRALGTTATVVVADARDLERARGILEAELVAIDEACSRFRRDSELARVNAAAGRPVVVSPLLLGAVMVALDAAAETGGAVDPTVGRAMREIGYDRDFAAGLRVPSFARLAPAPGPGAVAVDAEASTVSVARGAELDLGATAKALCADHAAAAIHAATGAGVLVSLGGDVAVDGPAPDPGWPVLVTDDHAADPATAGGQTICVATGGLATSSVTVRRWGSGARAAHHIVDPATGRPAPVVWRTVTVAAATCAHANAASTASIVLGEGAVAWLERRGLPARLVRPDGDVAYAGAWPREAVVA